MKERDQSRYVSRLAWSPSLPQEDDGPKESLSIRLSCLSSRQSPQPSIRTDHTSPEPTPFILPHPGIPDIRIDYYRHSSPFHSIRGVKFQLLARSECWPLRVDGGELVVVRVVRLDGGDQRTGERLDRGIALLEGRSGASVPTIA